MRKLTHPRFQGPKTADGRFVSPRFIGRTCAKHPQAYGQRYRLSGACIICARESSRAQSRRRAFVKRSSNVPIHVSAIINAVERVLRVRFDHAVRREIEDELRAVAGLVARYATKA
jgi:hypothetical protein